MSGALAGGEPGVPARLDGRDARSSSPDLLAAIKRHDGKGAKAAMRRHIEDIEEIVLDKF